MSQLTELFSNIATAIREKTGNTVPIQASSFPSAIADIAGAPTYIKGEKTIAGMTNAESLTFPELVGCDNVAVFCHSTVSASNYTFVAGAYIDGVGTATGHRGDSYTTYGGLTWDKTTGTMTFVKEAAYGLTTLRNSWECRYYGW